MQNDANAAPRPHPTCRIALNGAPREVAHGTTLARLLEVEGLAGRRVAVEVNREIVPRGAHATHALREGDRVEVVHALGGG
jgi:sulfur carrier protein